MDTHETRILLASNFNAGERRREEKRGLLRRRSDH
jgi:hypothetical protein